MPFFIEFEHSCLALATRLSMVGAAGRNAQEISAKIFLDGRHAGKGTNAVWARANFYPFAIYAYTHNFATET